MDDLHYIAEIYPSTTRFVNERALRGKKKKKKKESLTRWKKGLCYKYVIICIVVFDR